MAKVSEFESMTLEDLYNLAGDLRSEQQENRDRRKQVNEEIAKREAEIAEANRAGREQTIGGSDSG